MNQSRELFMFYREIQAWIELGCPNQSYGFKRHHGLCSNLDRYCDEHGYMTHTLAEEMREQFADDGLDLVYPFNNGRSIEYDMEEKWQNEARLKWVNDHAV